MMQTRPINSKELATLDAETRQIKARQQFTIRYFAGFALVVGLISAYAYFHIEPNDFWPWLLTSVGFMVAGLWGFLEMYLKWNKALDSIAWLKKENKVYSIVVRSNRYLAIPEQEDEGHYFLFQLSDDKMVYVGGQDFEISESFPGNHFEIVIGMDARRKIVLFDKYDLGEKIKPEIQLTPAQGVLLSDAQVEEINQQDPVIREIAAFVSGRIEEVKILS